MSSEQAATNPSTTTSTEEEKAPPKKKKAAEPAAAKAEEEPAPLSAEQRAVRTHELMTQLVRLYKDTLEARQRPLKIRRPADMTMEPHDLTIVYDIVIYSQDDAPITLKGRQTLSEALHPDLLPHTMRVVQQLLSDTITTPINTKLMRFLSGLVLPAQEEGSKSAPALTDRIVRDAKLPEDFEHDDRFDADALYGDSGPPDAAGSDADEEQA